MMGGNLTVVGTGYNVAGHVTAEARSRLVAARRVFYLMTDPASTSWLSTLNPAAESLHDCYRVGEPGLEACERMVERILAPVREGFDVCAAFYGHPAIFVPPGLESLRRARLEGHTASMLPAVSFEDCLYADLGVDPGVSGRAMYEATDFLVRPRRLDPTAALILLQVGAVGVTSFSEGDRPNRAALPFLQELLARWYPRDHTVAVYRITQLPVYQPEIDWLPLANLSEARLSVSSTLYVPPLARRPVDGEILASLGAGARPAEGGT
jgi:hypothetical protein